MSILYYLAEWRSPLLNTIMLVLTQVGSSKLLIIADILVFWCLDKQAGFYLLNMSGISVFVNQMLKSIVRMPRPWLLDQKFSIVEEARDGAEGFSFPSGHSQNTGAHMTAYFRLYSDRKWIKALSVTLVFLVPFSRMILGVHTPLDVGVGLLCGIVIALVFHILYVKKKKERFCHILAVLLALIQILYHRFLTDLSDINDAQALENAVTVFALMLGMWISYEVDRKWIRFSTEAPWKKQIVKAVCGLFLFLAVLYGLQYLLPLIKVQGYFAVFLSYFLGALTAGCLWPKIFSSLAWFQE